ncbi:MAG TPA: hypothetical protein PLI42_01820 [Candidatus Pacearchaeota archaeon]|nr:hypothetical protein [Candidatus Pacearchaeota archaeon]
MARIKGLTGFSANLEPQIAGSLDAREVVQYYNDLTTSSTWQALDNNIYVYKGMKVLVIEDPDTSKNGLYYLKDLDYSIENNWVKIGPVSGSGGYLTLTTTERLALPSGTTNWVYDTNLDRMFYMNADGQWVEV